MNIPQPREAVQKMQSYRPPLEGRRSKTRLDFNENTIGFSEFFPDQKADHLTAYPEYQELITALAGYLQLSEEQLLLTNGSDEGLFVSAFTFIEPSQGVAVISAPTFSLIPHYLRLCQADIVEVVVKDDLGFDFEGLGQALEKNVKLAMFASPDNPTGATIPLDTLEAWLQAHPQTVFVIDEAYYEYCEVSALSLLPRFSNLIVSRTFSKAWGLAGLRLGYLAAHPEVIEWMRRVRSPYSVNAMAVNSLLRLLPESERVFEQAQLLKQRMTRVLNSITSLGYNLTPGEANFFLIWAGFMAKLLVGYLNQNDILIRDRSSLQKMTGSVRVSVGSDEEMDRFLELFKEFGQRFALIFDLDDTLVDTSESFDICVQQLSGASREQLIQLRSEGGFNDDWDATAELLKRAGKPRPLADIQAEGHALYLQIAQSSEKQFFSEKLLKKLATRHPLYIFTGRTRQEYQPVWAERLDPLFQDVLCKGDIPDSPTKPAPDGLFSLMEKHDLLGGAYIGNSVDDMAAAVAAGFLAIGVTTNQSEEALRRAGAHHVISNVQQLPSLLMMKDE